MHIAPYPLAWPDHQRRHAKRSKSQFRTSLAGAMKNVRDSLNRFATDSERKIEGIVISSNVTLGSEKPADPGVAIWFLWDGEMRCIAVDKYEKVEENLQAIHHVIEARRTEMRHAGIEITRAAFKGFTALPPPDSTSDASDQAWWVALGVKPDASKAEIAKAYKTLAREAGGASVELNAAKEAGLKARGG